MWRGVKRFRIQYRDSIPARLDLNGKMTLESLRRLGMMENPFKRCIFQRGSVDIPRDPVIVEHGSGNFIVIHIIGGTGDPGVVPSALPDELEQVVDAGKNVVHENDGFKVFIFGIAEVVKGVKSGVSDFRKVLNSVIELPAGGTHGCFDGYT